MSAPSSPGTSGAGGDSQGMLRFQSDAPRLCVASLMLLQTGLGGAWNVGSSRWRWIGQIAGLLTCKAQSGESGIGDRARNAAREPDLTGQCGTGGVPGWRSIASA
jgi:hypothetical protein